MINEYAAALTGENFKNNLPEALRKMQKDYRSRGVPTILSEGLNELLLMISIKRPERVLELGTSVGCSAIAILSLLKNCNLVTVEKNEQVRTEALENFKKYGVSDRVVSLIGDSFDVVKNLTAKFDFIFLDCNKAAYAILYPLLKDLLNDGGVIFADNVLFRGYVAGEKECPKEYRSLVNKIDDFNKLVSSDKDMITCFFDVGDGIAVSVKK